MAALRQQQTFAVRMLWNGKVRFTSTADIYSDGEQVRFVHKSRLFQRSGRQRRQSSLARTPTYSCTTAI
jgi:hypothetical protein